MVLNGSEVIMRTKSPGGSTNLITNSGNGFGNRLVISGGPGVTVVQNARNGIGNRLVLDPDELLIDLDQIVPGMKLGQRSPPLPGLPVVDGKRDVVASYKGKENKFWTKREYHDSYDCNLYWDPSTKQWFRYYLDDDIFRPVATQPPAPPVEK